MTEEPDVLLIYKVIRQEKVFNHILLKNYQFPIDLHGK